MSLFLEILLVIVAILFLFYIFTVPQTVTYTIWNAYTGQRIARYTHVNITIYDWYMEELTTSPNENKSSEICWLLYRQVVWVVSQPYGDNGILRTYIPPDGF